MKRGFSVRQRGILEDDDTVLIELCKQPDRSAQHQKNLTPVIQLTLSKLEKIVSITINLIGKEVTVLMSK